MCLAAAQSIGRASAVDAPPRAREAELTHALFERHSHQLYGFCYAKLGSREEAEDAVQTTFLNAFRALERGVVPQAECAWLFKIAENVCLSRHRSSFRRRRVEAPSDLEVLQDAVPAPEHGGDELVGLERVLGEMPETQRRAILLREWQGLSYREIGDEMELTQAAVETLIFRARRSLAQGLEALDREEPGAIHQRSRRGVDAGGLVAALKTMLGTTAGMKAAATVVAVGSATMVAAAPPAVRHYIPGSEQALPKAPRVAVPRAKPAAVVVRLASAAPAVPVPRRTRPEARAHASAPARALVASRRAPVAAQARPAVPVESAAAPAPDVVAPVAPAAVEAPPPPPAPAQEPTAAAPPKSESPPPAAAATVTQPAPAPAKEKDTKIEQQSPPAAPSPQRRGSGSDHGEQGHDGDGGHGQQKPTVQAPATSAPAAPAPAATGTTPAAPATTAAPAAPTATVPTPAQPPAQEQQGQHGNGDGNGNHGD
jgi:RNA polymerase sigma factor (sigma-70 family)